jgi:RNA 3'-phosphate cyclase
VDAKINILKRGYYPAGGGSVELRVKPSTLSRIELSERGKILGYYGISHAHEELARYKVVERQAKSARRALYDELGVEAKIQREYCKTQSLGSGVVLWVEAENTFLGGSCLGEKSLSSELVGAEAGGELASAVKDGGALDRYMADQIIPLLALAGGKAKVCEITPHAKTNAEVVRLFGYNTRIENRMMTA